MSTPTIRYQIHPSDPAAHRFTVEVRVAAPDPEGQRLSLPAWIPGSYMIREFAKHLGPLTATGPGGDLPVEKLDKDTFRVAATDGPLTVTYEVYAWDLSVRCAHLDQTHGYFNGTSVFLQVDGQEDRPCELTIAPPDDPACAGWQVATGLTRAEGDPWGFGRFTAPDYDALVDHPVEMGCFERLDFEACGVPHHVVLTGRYRIDGERFCADLKAICEQHIRMFGEPAPVDRYLFQIMVVGDGYGGLEHRNSTSLICTRADLPQPGVEEATDGYIRLLGLCSHEYFHTWNVKRIKPAAYLPYDLSREAHTTLLWAFEGITSYYDDLGLVRSGRITAAQYLELVGQTVTRVWGGPGRHKQSLSDSSFDTWTKFYRQNEDSPNSIVSYYAKGSLVALALDLTIRKQTDGAKSLDHVMRRLWTQYGQPLVGVPEAGVEAAVTEVTGLDLSDFFDRMIRGTEDPDLAALLAPMGVGFHLRASEGPKDKGGKAGKLKAAALARRGNLGARTKGVAGGAKLTHVLDGGAAQAAGLSAGDVVVALDGLRVGADLPERVAARAPGDTLEVHAFRRDELMDFQLTVQAPPQTTAYLTLDDAEAVCVARRDGWLQTDG